MKNKLKELSKYCCKPANKQEYEFVKTCAKKGLGFNTMQSEKYEPEVYPFIQLSNAGDYLLSYFYKSGRSLIPVTQFCDILLKDESEFEFNPKVGEWCAIDYSNTSSNRVCMVVDVDDINIHISKSTLNGLKSLETRLIRPNKFATYRQPTPEEIQTAIDAWDDRVEFSFGMSYCMSNDSKTATARDGYKFRLSEDCKTVELIKS